MNTAMIALARVTLEATTPLTVGTGRGDDLIDSVCVTDANGLPTIPGSTLAGVLRHALPGGSDGERARGLFGYQSRDEGAASRVKVSWAQVHDANDRPVPLRWDVNRETLSAPERALLALLEGGVFRDHVRLNERGVVDGAGKFDERLVPKGARFTFELRVDGGDAQADLDMLLGSLSSSTLRIGGRTRRGYGAFKVMRVQARVFDLTKHLALWSKVPRALEEPVSIEVLPMRKVESLKGVAAAGVKRGYLVLSPLDYWLFGNGDPSRPSHTRGGRTVDMIPRSEPVISWDSKTGKALIDEREHAPNLVQSSGIKGALRHRAVFHLRRAAKLWAEDVQGEPAPPAEVELLFGAAKSRREGTPGCVHLGDAWLATAPAADRSRGSVRDGALDHVSIDRFTGGPMDGMLFSEAPLHGGAFKLEVLIEAERVPDEARKALSAAIDDLLGGRLAIGGGSSRGHGYVKGEIEGDELAAWLRDGGNRGA